MTNKINISYTINDRELFQKMLSLIDEKMPSMVEHYHMIKDELQKYKLRESIYSIKCLREKLFDFDLRLQEVGNMLEEYMLKTTKDEDEVIK